MGVFVIVSEKRICRRRKDKLSQLYFLGNRVIAELRKVSPQ